MSETSMLTEVFAIPSNCVAGVKVRNLIVIRTCEVLVAVR